MEEKRIKEILSDPNTWAWDGCTYPENSPDMSHVDKVIQENYKKALQLKKKQQKS